MRFFKFSVIITFLSSVNQAIAETAEATLPIIGKPIPKGLGFQPAVTEVARDLQWLDDFLLIIVTTQKLKLKIIQFMLINQAILFHIRKCGER